MTKVRSPNYPQMDLGTALATVRKAFEQDNRNKMSQAALAKHLGHGSLSGPALGKIGALRAFGLIEGSGDELRVSEDAVTALEAPEGSSERVGALRRLGLRPSLFQEIQKEFPTAPSAENLRFWLIKRKFAGDAAEKAASSYLATMRLVNGGAASYNSSEQLGGKGEKKGFTPPPPPKRTEVKIMDGERELTTGLLSKDSSFRLIVSGPVGVKEIERLIAKLNLDKEILAEPDPAKDNEKEEWET